MMFPNVGSTLIRGSYYSLIAILALFLPIIASPAEAADQESLATCTLQRNGSELSGPCGPLLVVGFDHIPIVKLQQVKTSETGVWLDDIVPASIWVGTMTDTHETESSEPIEFETYARDWGSCAPMRDGSLLEMFASHHPSCNSTYSHIIKSRRARSIRR
jgi:hypothetical protein